MRDRVTIALGLSVALLSLTGWTQERSSPVEKYRALKYPPNVENFDNGWKERVAADFEIINSADLPSLRAALKDPDLYVRAMAARALGIRADKASADALARLTEGDPEYLVRIRAVESLGFLKMKSDVIRRARKDANAGVRWSSRLAAGQLERDTDYAALVRQGYRAGIKPEAMDAAKVGRPAPDFTARTTDGAEFKLSDVLGKNPIVMYFSAFDG